jgi:hypothetical protein
MLLAEVDRHACTLDKLLDHYFPSDEDRWPAAHGIGLWVCMTVDVFFLECIYQAPSPELQIFINLDPLDLRSPRFTIPSMLPR